MCCVCMQMEVVSEHRWPWKELALTLTYQPKDHQSFEKGGYRISCGVSVLFLVRVSECKEGDC